VAKELHPHAYALRQQQRLYERRVRSQNFRRRRARIPNPKSASHAKDSIQVGTNKPPQPSTYLFLLFCRSCEACDRKRSRLRLAASDREDVCIRESSAGRRQSEPLWRVGLERRIVLLVR
jgi:hypothetical protein